MANGNDWSAGTYVLTVDRYDKPIYEGEGAIRQQVDVESYVKGDTVELDDRDARRLGPEGSIAPEGTARAKAAQGVISAEAIASTSHLSLAEKKANLEALKQQVEEEEATVSNMESEVDEDELEPIPVAAHPGTAAPAGDPDLAEEGARPKRRGNRQAAATSQQRKANQED